MTVFFQAQLSILEPVPQNPSSKPLTHWAAAASMVVESAVVHGWEIMLLFKLKVMSIVWIQDCSSANITFTEQDSQAITLKFFVMQKAVSLVAINWITEFFNNNGDIINIPRCYFEPIQLIIE